jgi:hypothetical protein
MILIVLDLPVKQLKEFLKTSDKEIASIDINPVKN